MKKYLVLILLAVIVSSCQDEILNDSNPVIENVNVNLSMDEAMSIANDNPTNLSEDEILAMVNDFSSSLGSKTRSAANPRMSIVGSYRIGGIISSKTTRGTTTDSIPVYEVCLQSGEKSGYALVSADSRSAGVLAYIENGNFEKKDSTGACLMLKLAEASTVSEINKIERLKVELREKTLKKVASCLGKSTVTYEEIKDLIEVNGVKSHETTSRSTAYDKPLSQIISLMPQNGGAVLKTEWGQNNPYNLLLPKSYNAKYHTETNYPMGCAITAGVQTLAAIAPSMTIDGTVIDWAFVTKKPKLNYNSYFGGDYEEAMMISKVVKHMYEGTNTTPNIDEDFKYGPYDDPNIPCVKSSTTSVSNLLNYLKKYVSCGTYYNKYAPDPLLNTINANRQMPCVAIMGGTHTANEQAEKGSHAWVIDGYAICTKTSREILRNNDLYFHANMGWDGTDNGFYTDLTESLKDESGADLTEATTTLSEVFKKALNNDKLTVKVENLKNADVASVLTLSEQGRRMQDMMKMYAAGGMGGMDPSMFAADQTLTLNANNELVKYILDNKDSEHVPMFAEQLYDLAMLSNQPLSVDQMTKFVKRSNDIMLLLTK